MSVKQKFRKSKKTKGKSNKNKKYNNEKRSKIQRKTKKRVLRGGRIVGLRMKNSFLGLSTGECENFFKDIKQTYPNGIPPEELVSGTQGKTDFEYCSKKFIQKGLDDHIPEVSPPSTPAPEPEEPVVEDNAGLTEQRLAQDDSRAPEAPLEPGSSGVEVNQEAPAEAALQEEEAEAIKKRKEEAEDQVAKDSEVQTDEMPDSTQTLALSKQHEDLAGKYEELEKNEKVSDIREIYKNAKEYHNRISSRLWIRSTEQEETEKSKTSPGEETDAPAQLQAPTPANVQQDQTDTISQPIALYVAPEAKLVNPEIVDDLKLFPRECFGKYSICKKKINEADNQSFFCYQFFKRMKEFFIKRSTSIDFNSLLSDDNPPPFSTSPNFIERYLNFIEFYNQHMADGDDTKKFVVKRDDRGGVDTNPKDKKYIAMEKYPEIDLKTFFDNCYKLYKLSLPEVCYLRLADSAYDNEKLRSDVSTTMTTEELRNKLDSFTPTIFSPTSIEKENLGIVIQVLSQYKQKYEELNKEFRGSKLFSELSAYNNILPSGDSLSQSILSVPRDSNGHSLLDFIQFIVNEKLLFPVFGIVCTTSTDKTRADVRKGIQNIITESQGSIRKIVDDRSIFTTTCPFIQNNPDIKKKIIDLIMSNNEKITHPETFDFPSDEEKKCAQRSINFVNELKEQRNDFKTDIFFHMIIFACYNTMNSEDGRWGIQGTTLMILFMNIFIINFFIDILREVNTSCLQFLDKEPGSVILIDKNVSTFLEFIIELKSFLLDLKVKEKTGGEYKVDEDAITELYERFEEIQRSIKERNNETLKFIEGLELDKYPQDSRESDKSDKSDKSNKSDKTKFKIMHEYYLRLKMIDVCTELKQNVEGVYTQEYPGEIKKLESKQPVLEFSDDMSQRFNASKFKKSQLVDIKEGCKLFVVKDLIMFARYLRKNKQTESSVVLENNFLIQLNRCCDPGDIFAKGVDSREHLKRISRAFYGLSELWPYINDEQKPKILKLPGVKALIEKFKNESDFKTKVKWQCNDDGKAEKKGGLRWWGKSENRKDIIEHITPDQLPQICEADVNNSPLKDLINLEPELVLEQSEIQQETPEQTAARIQIETARENAEEEFARDKAEAEAEAEAEALKNPKLTQEQKDEIRKNNKLKLAMSYASILNNENLDKNSDLVKRAEEFADKNKAIYLEAKALLFVGQKPPKYESENLSVQATIDERSKQQTERNKQIQAKTYEPRGSTSLFGKFTNVLKSVNPFSTGGTTSTKTKHKSNHKSKAKTQSKPKHKNKSKPKPKPKHRTKAKTIKKNKRAHHKFDKKYTRKR
jgi:hypothetical protein